MNIQKYVLSKHGILLRIGLESQWDPDEILVKWKDIKPILDPMLTREEIEKAKKFSNK